MDSDSLKEQIRNIINENKHTLPVGQQYLLYTGTKYICYNFLKDTLELTNHIRRIFSDCWCVQKTPEEAEAQLYRLYKHPEQGSKEWLNRRQTVDYFLTIPFEGETLEVSVLSLYQNLYMLYTEELYQLLGILEGIFDRYKGHLFE